NGDVVLEDLLVQERELPIGLEQLEGQRAVLSQVGDDVDARVELVEERTDQRNVRGWGRKDERKKARHPRNHRVEGIVRPSSGGVPELDGALVDEPPREGILDDLERSVELQVQAFR